MYSNWYWYLKKYYITDYYYLMYIYLYRDLKVFTSLNKLFIFYINMTKKNIIEVKLL